MIYAKMILSIAKTVGVPGQLLLAICTYETNLQNVMVPHDGGSPSYGICQVKEATAKMFGYKGDADDLMVPKTNVRYAAKYLRYQLERYDNNWCMAAAAYNSGTYNESKKIPGKPRNMKYISRVREFLEDELHHKISCEDSEVDMVARNGE